MFGTIKSLSHVVDEEIQLNPREDGSRRWVVMSLPLNQKARPMVGDWAARTEPTPFNVANRSGWSDLAV